MEKSEKRLEKRRNERGGGGSGVPALYPACAEAVQGPRGANNSCSSLHAHTHVWASCDFMGETGETQLEPDDSTFSTMRRKKMTRLVQGISTD